ncbi:MAG: hypothetical protein JW728_01320 [Candidatus Aureabacteria bacterium]|nr:hypothetical protein [Candidatus Auribacterota bacterium]
MRAGTDIYVCDGCLKELRKSDLRYCVRIEGVCAPQDCIKQGNGRADIKEEINILIKNMKNTPERELVNQVYSERYYDLCPQCYKSFFDGPLRSIHEKNNNR